MDAISALVSQTTITADAVDQIMAIFKLQAKANKDTVTAQSVLRNCAQAERVAKEKQALENALQLEIQHGQVTPSPIFQVKNTEDPASAKSALPNITQDEYKAPQFANTRQQRRTRIITEDFML